jgi:hypothetical protein
MKASFLLVRHPKVMQKVRAEVSSFRDAKPLTRDDLRGFKYLQNVLKEGGMKYATMHSFSDIDQSSDCTPPCLSTPEPP